MPGLVEQGGGEVLAGLEPLVERGGCLQLVDELLRHRLARLVMLGVVGEHLGPQHPHLVDLAGELDEVAEHVGSGELRVGHLREQAVKGVPELVEERVDLVVGEQCRVRPAAGLRARCGC